MPTLQVHIWAENASVGVRQWTADAMESWQDTGGLTTQRIDNAVREHVREIAQSKSLLNKECAGPGQWHLLIDRWVAEISDMES